LIGIGFEKILLGEDVFIRLPEKIPNSRLATLSPPTYT
jgi:hypothetical protein